MARRDVLGALCLSAWLLTACHTYSAIAVDGLGAGNDVKLAITPDGSDKLRAAVGPHATTIDGTVVRRDSTGLLIAVSEVTRDNGLSDLLRGEQIRVPADAVATAQIKRINTMKSLLVAGAIGLGSALAIRGGTDGIFGPQGGGGGTTSK